MPFERRQIIDDNYAMRIDNPELPEGLSNTAAGQTELDRASLVCRDGTTSQGAQRDEN